MKKSEVVLIGRKPAPACVAAVAIALQRADWVKLKARGRLISKAVDVAEMAKRTLRARVGEIKIGTETLTIERRIKHVSLARAVAVTTDTANNKVKIEADQNPS